MDSTRSAIPMTGGDLSGEDVIFLTEYTTSGSVRLTREEAADLASVMYRGDDQRARGRPVVTVTPERATDCYRITPSSIVGALRVGKRRFTIQPKVGNARVMLMIAYTMRLADWRPEEADFMTTQTLIDALVPSFLREVEGVVRAGLVEDYLLRQEVGQQPRGRLRFDRLARQPVPIPSYYEYDDFSIDTLENRLLRAALYRVRDGAILNPEYGRRARRLDVEFEGVAWEPFAPHDVPQPRLTDRNRHYLRALALARLILANLSIDLGEPSARSQALLLDMNKVFQDFVFAVLQEELRFRGQFLIRNASGKHLYLDKNRIIHLLPDFSLWRGRNCTLVGDLKYKDLDEKAVRAADIYQVISYAIASGLSRAHLVYAGAEAESMVRIRNSNIEIQVLTLDLTAQDDLLIQQVRDLALKMLVL